MIRGDKNLIIEIFQALETDWALCDEKDEDDHMVFVNEDRDQHETLKPSKALVKELEKEQYIQLDEKRSDPKERERDYMEFFEETIPVPFVYFYKVTKKGKELYAE